MRRIILLLLLPLVTACAGRVGMSFGIFSIATLGVCRQARSYYKHFRVSRTYSTRIDTLALIVARELDGDHYDATNGLSTYGRHPVLDSVRYDIKVKYDSTRTLRDSVDGKVVATREHTTRIVTGSFRITLRPIGQDKTEMRGELYRIPFCPVGVRYDARVEQPTFEFFRTVDSLTERSSTPPDSSR